VTELFTLRPLQEDAMSLLRESMRNSIAIERAVRTVIQAPTGFGKTVLAAHMCHGSIVRRQRVAFVVPQINLIQQSFDRFQANGISAGDMGIVQANHPWRRPHAPLQICSIGTLASRGFPEVKRVIVDECHLQFKSVLKWMDDHPAIQFIGLSATPWARGMGNHWNDLVVPTTLKQLIAEEWLVKPRVFIGMTPDLSQVPTTAGDYQQDALSDAMSSKTIIGDVVDNWLRRGENRPTLCFAVDRAHAAKLHDEFMNAGVGSAYVDGEMDREERENILVRFRAGHVRVICSVGTMTTGIDEDFRCLIIARPTKSEILLVQMVGRGLRTADGKTDCLIFDHCDKDSGHQKLCRPNGLVSDIHHERLRTSAIDAAERAERQERERTTPQPRECGSCGFLIPAGVRECPSCGFAPVRTSTVVARDGELNELGVDPIVTALTTGVSVKDRIAAQGKQSVYSQLWAMKGTKADGWCAHTYKRVFDVWPHGLSRTPAEPTPELMLFVHHLNISFSRSRQNATDRAASAGDQASLADAA
jgi:DNA repair protein RadD